MGNMQISAQQGIFKLMDRLFGKIMKGFSFKRKLLFFFLLISLGPMLIIGTIVYSSSRMAITNKITDYSIDGLTKSKQHMELVIKKYEDLSYNFITVADVNRLFTGMAMGEGFERITAINELKNYLSSIHYADDNLVTIRFSCPDGISMNIGKELTSLLSTVFPEEENNEVVRKAQGRIVWFPPVKSDAAHEEHLIVMGRMIRNPSTGQNLGNVFFFIDEAGIDQMLNEYLYRVGGITERGIQVSYTVLIDEDGRIISSPAKDELNQNVFDLIKKEKQLQALMNEEAGEGELASSFTDHFGEKEVQITYEKINDQWSLLGVAPTSYLYQETRLVGLVTLILVLISGISAVLISLYVSITISRFLENVVHGMEKMEDGDLTTRVVLETNDELGVLGAGFNRMVEKVSDLLVSTKEAINDVKIRSGVVERNSEQSAQAAVDVATAMEQISRGTQEQTTEAEKTSKMMSQLAFLIDDTVGKAGEVEEITSSTRSLGVNTQEAIKTLIEKAKQAAEITHAFVDNIDQLDNSAQQISQITEAITTIAEQTNLLALNAAIEAARAGEAGRGFAVVADEVNKLASQTQEAARMIEGILQTIGKQTQLSKKTAEQVYQVVDEQNSAVDLTKQAFSEVIRAMDNVVTRMSGMTGNIGSINTLKEETVQAVLNIGAISEETAASAEEVSASAEEQTGMAETAKQMAEALNTMAERLVETISHFVFESQE